MIENHGKQNMGLAKAQQTSLKSLPECRESLYFTNTFVSMVLRLYIRGWDSVDQADREILQHLSWTLEMGIRLSADEFVGELIEYLRKCASASNGSMQLLNLFNEAIGAQQSRDKITTFLERVSRRLIREK